MSRGKQQFLIFSFGFILAAILLVSGYFIYNKVAGKSNKQVDETLKMTNVLVATKKVEKGDELKPELFTMASRPAKDVPLNSIIDINMITGKRANSVMDPNAVITDSMIISTEDLYKPDERLNDYTLQGHLVAGTVKEGDWIDVEMVRANGDNSTVLSKKQVKKLIDNRAIIQVTAAERYYINHALAEQSAGLGHIEAILYLDETQPAAKVNYVPAKIDSNNKAAAVVPVQTPPVEIQQPVQKKTTEKPAEKQPTPVPQSTQEGRTR